MATLVLLLSSVGPIVFALAAIFGAFGKEDPPFTGDKLIYRS